MTYACKLEHFSSKILEYRGDINGCLGTDAHLVLCVLFQETLDTTAWKLRRKAELAALACVEDEVDYYCGKSKEEARNIAAPRGTLVDGGDAQKKHEGRTMRMLQMDKCKHRTRCIPADRRAQNGSVASSAPRRPKSSLPSSCPQMTCLFRRPLRQCSVASC